MTCRERSLPGLQISAQRGRGAWRHGEVIMTLIRQLRPTDRTALSSASTGDGVRERLDALPAGTFRACPTCTSVIYGRKLEEALSVCPDTSR
jgi:hypothetical protein